MSIVDVEKLLAPVSPDLPCGEDLEYDPAFAAMEKAARGKPEQQFGETVVAEEEPDWAEVRRQALDVLSRSKDLRAAVHLTRALARTHGYEGLADGLRLVRGLVERHWEGLHPLLDPDDDHDPTLRVNTLAALADTDATLRALRDAPLVSSRALGRYSLKDVQVATGALPGPADGKAPDLGAIDAAFTGCELEPLQATEAAVGRAEEDAAALERLVTDRVGSSQTVTLAELSKLLRAARHVLAERLGRRGIGAAPAGAPVADDATGQPAGPGAPTAAAAGPVASREDVIRVLDQACEYFQRHEPSSPVPILLQRAKRLVSKNFLDIVRDLAPDGLSQVEAIRGPEPES